MVHRDVCPANILIRDDGTGVVTDFDLVRAFDTTGGTRTSAMGRFVYAAPETMTDAADVGPPADIYSLGMSALFVLLGRELPAAVVRDQRKTLDSVDCSAPVRRVIEKAIRWEPQRRFQTVREFREAFATAVSAPLKKGRFSRTIHQRIVLVVDDEKFIREILAEFLGMEGATVFTAVSVAEAQAILAKQPIDVALIDLNLSPLRRGDRARNEGLDLLKEIRGMPSPPECIMITGFGTVENAIEAMKAGAFDYMLKPFKVEEVQANVAAACERR
jgi:CheY-like chemotaxis protein